MRLRFFYILAGFLLGSVASEANDEIKKGQFPYMAFIYYPDDSVVDENGVRLTRSGILLKPNWLVTSSLENRIPMSFPEKTLIARLGSVSVDSNFTFNEDEEEQESEIIQIIRPYNFSSKEWWYSDISLLKTLTPFKITTAVAFTPISHKLEINDKKCFMLVYARPAFNDTMDRLLTQIPVLDVRSTAKCGSHFREQTMVCALDGDDKKNVTNDPNYCIGNGGGPLVCESIIYGLQTYSHGCQKPYLYQIFSGWANFISCGIQDTCKEKQCEKICTVINKDSEKSTTKQLEQLISQVITTKEKPTTTESENDSDDELGPDRPTATTKKDVDDTTLTSTFITEEASPETAASAETQSTTIEQNLRRANVEAQEQPRKKSSAAILTPFSTQLPILFWVAINFA